MQQVRKVPAPLPPNAQRPISGVQRRNAFRRATIAEQPLPLWLIALLDQRVTGTLRMTTPNGEHRLHMADGRPVAVESPSDIAPLSLMLLKQKAISASTLKELTEEQREDPNHLVNIVEPGVLRRTVDLRSMLRATALFTLRPDTLVDVTPPMEPPEATRIFINPIALITRGLRGLAGRAEPSSVIELLRERTLAIHPDAPVEELELLRFEMQVIEALHESPRTYEELSEMRFVHPRALSATLYILHQMRFLEGSGAPPVRAWTDDDTTPVAQLDIEEPTKPGAGQVVVPEIPAPRAPTRRARAPRAPALQTPTPQTQTPQTPAPQTPAPRTPAPQTPAPRTPAPRTPAPGTPVPEGRASDPEPSLPAPRAAELPSSGLLSHERRRRPEQSRAPGKPKELVTASVPTRAELEARVAAMEGENFFEMLKVPLTASGDEISAAYAKQVFVYHPDRLPKELERLANKICSRLGEATRTLSDVTARAQHRQQVEECGATPAERVALAMRAAKLYEQAERLVRTGDYAHAERLLYRAIADDGEQPAYLVLLAWCQAEAMSAPPPPAGQLTDAFNAQLRMLQKALRIDEKDAKARYYFAQLLKRSGRVDAAQRQFKLVLVLQPHNIGAAREVRLFEMRKRNRAERGILRRILRRDGD